MYEQMKVNTLLIVSRCISLLELDNLQNGDVEY